MELGLAGKVAIVGGGSRGIGKAIAMGLAKEGCRVAIAARGEEALRQAAVEIIDATGTEALPVVCDMAKHDDVRRLVAQTVERFGRLDIVVNNAGGPPFGSFEQHSEEAWQAAIETNFLSAVRTIREALPYLRRQGGGRIINLTSYAVKQPLDGLILSNSVRLAVVGLAKTLSRELGPENILVNNVCPGPTLTGRMESLMRSRAAAQGKSYEEILAQENAQIPVGHMGAPEDVAALVVFLASEPARHITGATIQVDGGATAAVF
ncbi:MAG: SDR family oxidoreductase [Dehalococcoidia bacterium]|nr:SDR family oxidoreductase [Dehalococcoidia bacterium]